MLLYSENFTHLACRWCQGKHCRFSKTGNLRFPGCSRHWELLDRPANTSQIITGWDFYYGHLRTDLKSIWIWMSAHLCNEGQGRGIVGKKKGRKKPPKNHLPQMLCHGANLLGQWSGDLYVNQETFATEYRTQSTCCPKRNILNSCVGYHRHSFTEKHACSHTPQSDLSGLNGMQKAMYNVKSHLANHRQPAYTDVLNSARKQEVTIARRENTTESFILGTDRDPVWFNWFHGFQGSGVNEELKLWRLTIQGFEGYLFNLIKQYDVQGDGK